MSSCLLVLWFTFACGQNLLPAPAAEPTVAEHTVFIATLQHSLNVEKVKVGDPVELYTEQATLIGKGRVVPEFSRLHGTVVEAKPISETNRVRARLSIVVHKAVWRGGTARLHGFITGFGSKTLGTVFVRGAPLVIHPQQFLKGVTLRRIIRPSPGSVLVREGKNFSVPDGMPVVIEHSEVCD